VTVFIAGSFGLRTEGRKLRAGARFPAIWSVGAKDAGLFKNMVSISISWHFRAAPKLAAMIAGEIEFLAIAGSNSERGDHGADVVSLAITTERLVVSLIALPSIQRRESPGKAVGTPLRHLHRYGGAHGDTSLVWSRLKMCRSSRPVRSRQTWRRCAAAAFNRDTFLSDDYSGAARRLSRLPDIASRCRMLRADHRAAQFHGAAPRRRDQLRQIDIGSDQRIKRTSYSPSI
jgi:hypothetical protein